MTRASTHGTTATRRSRRTNVLTLVTTRSGRIEVDPEGRETCDIAQDDTTVDRLHDGLAARGEDLHPALVDPVR